LTIGTASAADSAPCAAIDPFFSEPVYHLFSRGSQDDGINPNPVIAMPCLSITRHIGRALSRFAGANEGNIAIMFAAALVPLLGLIGFAIDYSRANMARSSMQAAMDSTALMLSRDLTQGLITPSQIPQKAQAYFAALFTNKDAQGTVSITATYTPGTSNTSATIQISGSGSITTDFLKVLDFAFPVTTHD
jgi:Flp pilus assembly protein TadG